MTDPTLSNPKELGPRYLSSQGAARLGGLLAGLDRLDQILALPVHPHSAAQALVFERYLLQSKLGAGSNGVVLLADDPLLKRQVIIKVPQPVVLTDPELRERFVREARAAAILEHPGIVPVFEAGELDTLPYLVAGYVPGPTLAKWLKDHSRPTKPEEAARFVAAAARALQHAHERGVLHCDLTPSNILLQPIDPARVDSLDSYLPAITDFGLARLVEDDPALTQTFRIAGTPLYMAPEQARGERRHLTARADVYALGAILYHLLTGRALFCGESSGDVLRQVVSDNPECPRKLNPAVSRDLRAICLKCLKKNPQERYASAAELAVDLSRYLDGKPVGARKLALVTHAARWAVQNPTWIVATTVCCGLMIGLIAVVVDRYLQGIQHDADMRIVQDHAEASKFIVTIERVRKRRVDQEPDWPASNLADLRHLAAASVGREHLPLLRTEAVAALGGVDLGHPRAVAVGFQAYNPAFSPDGKILALGSWRPDEKGTCSVRLIDPTTGAELHVFQYSADLEWEHRYTTFKNRQLTNFDGCRSLTFSPDGQWLVLGTRSGWLVRWDLSELKPTPVRWRHAPPATDPTQERVNRLAFTGTGRLLLSSDDDRLVAWDTRRGWIEVARPVGVPGTVILPTRPGEPLFTKINWELKPVHETEPWIGERICDFHGLAPVAGPRGELLFAVRHENTVAPFASALADEEATGLMPPFLSPHQTRTDDCIIENLAVSPNGLYLATGAEHLGRLKLWSVTSGRLLSARSLGGGSLRLAFSPDGQSLAVCVEDRTLLFTLPKRTTATILCLQEYPLSDAAVGHRSVATIGKGPHSSVLRTIPTSAQTGWWIGETISDSSMKKDNNNEWRVAYNPTSGELAFSGDGIVRRRHFREPATTQVGGNVSNLRDLGFSPDGRIWIAADELMRLSPNAPTLTIPLGLGNRDRPHPVCVDTCAPNLMAGLSNGALVSADLQDGTITDRRSVFNHPVTAIRSDPVRGCVVVGSGVGEVKALELKTGVVVLDLPDAHRDAVTAIAFGPRGWLATGSLDRTVKVWDPNGQLVLTLLQRRSVRRIFWSDDGSALTILAEGERGLRRWNLALLKKSLTEMALDPALP